MELVYLWVEDYKNIHKQGFNFSPRFNCNYDETNNELTIEENKDYINIFPENINITAIVGKNGSGKSSLLKFVIEQNFDIALFFKDSKLYMYNNTNIKVNNKTQYDYKKFDKYSLNIFKSYNKLIYLQTFIDINKYEIGDFSTIPRYFFNLSNKITILQELYKINIKLRNAFRINSNQKNIDIPLHSYFLTLKNEYLNKIIQNYKDLYPFLNEYFNIQEIVYEIRNLGDIFYASPFFKNSYSTDKFLKEMYNIYEEAYNIDKLIILFFIFIYIRNHEINKKLKINFNKINNKNFKKYYEKILKNNNDEEYVLKWKKFIDLFIKQNKNFEDFINSYFEVYDLIKHDILIFNFFPELSSGEEKILYIIVNIFHSLTRDNLSIPDFEKNILLVLDESDTFLHPNWQKKFLYLIINFLTKMFPNKKFHLFFTTHSPFLLSDLPKENIIFLDTYKKEDKEVKKRLQQVDNCKVLSKDEALEKKQTFGANIHILLSDSFFMRDGLMGEFAKSKIEEVIKFLNNEKSEIKDYIEAESIINIIGEPILQKKLQVMLERYKEENNLINPQDIEKQIQELQEKLNRIKKNG